MRKENEKIILSGNDAIEMLKEIEIILQSLHHQGSYYGAKKMQNSQEYKHETTIFIDDWLVTSRLVKIRSILT